VVIATHGRSFYVLDDITPLRQLKPTLTSEDLHLFAPPKAERNVSQARIDYYLAKPAEKVTIDILDAKGQVVRTFTGTPNDQANGRGRGGRGRGRGGADAGDTAAAEPGAAGDPAAGGDFGGGGGGGGRGGRGGVVNAPDKAGLNRFTWDMRTPPAKTFEGMVLWSGNTQGPEVVPGTYSVRLTADGKSYTEKLIIEKDPRLDSVTVADLAEQFSLALKVRDDLTQSNEIVILVRELKRQMDDRLKQNSDAVLKTSLDSFRDKLSAIEEEVYQVQNRSGQDPLNFPIKLNNKIAALGASIEHGDGKPTTASYEVYKLLNGKLAEQQNKLDALLKSTLPSVNKELTNRSLKELVPTKTETPTPRAGAAPAPGQ
jgi:hypothetical protein